MWDWQWPIIGLSVVIAVTALLIACRASRLARANEQYLITRIDVLENEFSAIMDGAFGMADCLQDVETNLKDTVQRQEQLQQQDLGNLPYNEAVRLASKGASVDELVEQCCLSRSEAELVELLHKKSPPVINAEHEFSWAQFEKPQKTDK